MEGPPRRRRFLRGGPPTGPGETAPRLIALADTSILIDHLRGSGPATRLLVAAFQADQRVVASVLTKVEVLAGMRDSEAEATRDLMTVIEWVAVDDEIAERAGDLARSFIRSHPGIDTTDYVIAATAERLSATLWTQNVRHFPMLPGLEAPY